MQFEVITKTVILSGNSSSDRSPDTSTVNKDYITPIPNNFDDNLKYTGPNTRSRAHQNKRYHRKSRSVESLFSDTKGNISTSVPSDQIGKENTPKRLNKNTELLGLKFFGVDNSCTISKMNNTVLSLETAIKLMIGQDLNIYSNQIKRTPGYLQLELTSTRQSQRESVHDYSSKVENLLNELCNVSTKGKSTTDATVIHTFIKEITLTTYVEGLLPHLRTVIKSRNFETLEDVMKASLEEQKIYQSSKETQRVLRGNQGRNNNQKYGNRGQDTGQQNFQSKVHSNPNNKDVKKLTCTYCNKPGHSEIIKLIDNHALYKIPQCTKKIVKLLVDTGADLNLIKLDALHDDIQVSDTKIFMLQGINDQTVKTMGFTMLTVINRNQFSESEFHVVPTNFPIIGDGILGKPFLTENQIGVGKGEITSTLDDVTTIPARCETIIPVDLIYKLKNIRAY
ncbi:hypothetical protein QTP88_022024 [Uroleucon formosanum]